MFTPTYTSRTLCSLTLLFLISTPVLGVRETNQDLDSSPSPLITNTKQTLSPEESKGDPLSRPPEIDYNKIFNDVQEKSNLTKAMEQLDYAIYLKKKYPNSESDIPELHVAIQKVGNSLLHYLGEGKQHQKSNLIQDILADYAKTAKITFSEYKLFGLQVMFALSIDKPSTGYRIPKEILKSKIKTRENINALEKTNLANYITYSDYVFDPKSGKSFLKFLQEIPIFLEDGIIGLQTFNKSILEGFALFAVSLNPGMAHGGLISKDPVDFGFHDLRHGISFMSEINPRLGEPKPFIKILFNFFDKVFDKSLKEEDSLQLRKQQASIFLLSHEIFTDKSVQLKLEKKLEKLDSIATNMISPNFVNYVFEEALNYVDEYFITPKLFYKRRAQSIIDDGILRLCFGKEKASPDSMNLKIEELRNIKEEDIAMEISQDLSQCKYTVSIPSGKFETLTLRGGAHSDYVVSCHLYCDDYEPLMNFLGMKVLNNNSGAFPTYDILDLNKKVKDLLLDFQKFALG